MQKRKRGAAPKNPTLLLLLNKCKTMVRIFKNGSASSKKAVLRTFQLSPQPFGNDGS